jgi:hypothetical protein
MNDTTKDTIYRTGVGLASECRDLPDMDHGVFDRLVTHAGFVDHRSSRVELADASDVARLPSCPGRAYYIAGQAPCYFKAGGSDRKLSTNSCNADLGNGFIEKTRGTSGWRSACQTLSNTP